MIFYFSATGNTRWAAQRLAEATGERLIDMARPLPTAPPYTLQPDERVGFCFPVHGWRPPGLVRSFVGQLSLQTRGHYVYALCTAGDTIGETIDLFRADLAARGIGLDAAFSLLMPESYVGLPFMNVDTPDNEQRKLQAADSRLKTLADTIRSRGHGDGHLDIGRWPRINSRLIGSVFVRHLITDKPFRVEHDRCVKCGICANVCPVGDIRGGLGHEPQWLHNGACLTCFACYHHCPHHAIEYGSRTRGKGQYFFGHAKRGQGR